MAVALVLAQARYWLTVVPRVRRELCCWDARARAIRDPVLRGHAAQKLRDEWANTEAIATLCTLAPRRHRRAAVEAIVALQVMYDYLDAVTEELVSDPIRNGRQMHRAFAVALTPDADPLDYYRHHPQSEDGGYLDALIARCQRSLVDLPAISRVLPVARSVAERFGEAQTRSHAVPSEGAAQLAEWAARPAAAADMRWWEWAGGAAASVLALHALISAAADSRTTQVEARRIDRAYLLHSTLATMLDSLIDDEHDATDGGHRYIAYYATVDEAANGIATVARAATAAARDLPNPAHHAMTVAGVVSFYLSTPAARLEPARTVALRVIAELRPIIVPILATLRVWRRLRRGLP